MAEIRRKTVWGYRSKALWSRGVILALPLLFFPVSGAWAEPGKAAGRAQQHRYSNRRADTCCC